jgi:outer membrane protein TolC
MKIACTRTKSAGLVALSCGLLILSGLTVAIGQTQGGFNGPSSSSGPSAYAPEANTSESSASEPASPASYSSTQSPFLSSVPEGKATGTVLPLSFKEAIDRALRSNLGLLLSSDSSLAARGKKWEELSRLLPNISASANQSAQQIDLAALGFRFNFPGVPPVIGPIGTFDARVYLSAPLFDWHSIQRERGARANEVAARYKYNDAREMVVLAAGNEYLLSLSAAARVDAAQAELETAQALFNKAQDQQAAGISPAIDTLRAQVELQTRQQQLIVARNNYAKQKLALARTIGLPPGQEFNLTDQAPYKPLTPMSVDQALQRAYMGRGDYQAAAQQVRAAEQFRRAATAEHLPTLDISGNYGAAGVNVGDSHGVFLAGATLAIPIFAGGRARADALQAEATLRQTRQQLESLRSQIDYDVRSALLDLSAANDQVQVARSALDLASQTLVQARDRFSAGVADNLEVIEAQDAVASANENYIGSLYAHNVAKVLLARAIGFAEQGVKQYLEGKDK